MAFCSPTNTLLIGSSVLRSCVVACCVFSLCANKQTNTERKDGAVREADHPIHRDTRRTSELHWVRVDTNHHQRDSFTFVIDVIDAMVVVPRMRVWVL